METNTIERVYGKSKLLYSQKQVTEAIDRLSVKLAARVAGSKLTVVCMMNGGIMLSAAIMRRLHMPLRFEHIHLTRYRSSQHGAGLEWHTKPQQTLSGRTVLLLDDICDEGESLSEAVKAVKLAGAREVITAVLIRRRRAESCFSPDLAAIECGAGFVLGWGMDFAGYGRNLSEIRVLDDNQ